MPHITKSMEKAAGLTKSKSPLQDSIRRLRKNKLAMAAFWILIVITLLSVFADLIAPYPYAQQNYAERFVYPCLAHPFGTDNLGRDLLSRILKGGQISLLISFLSVVIAVLVGGGLGATAAYFEGSRVGNIYSTIIMRVVDVIMTLPSFLWAIAVAAVLGTGIFNTCIAITIGTIPTFVRIIYASVLTVKNEEFIEAAHATGCNHARVLAKYVIPNCLAPLIVNVTLRLGIALMNISALSFIGLGVEAPTPEWGSILNAGRQFIRDFYPIIVFPAIVIGITLIAFNILGDGLRDAMDPRLKR